MAQSAAAIFGFGGSTQPDDILAVRPFNRKGIPMIQKHLTIVALAGPSGSGKSELVQRLVEMYPDNLARWKQATTRPKRGPGDDYVFLTKAMYDVVRYTLTCRTDFNGNFYGSNRQELDEWAEQSLMPSLVEVLQEERRGQVRA